MNIKTILSVSATLAALTSAFAQRLPPGTEVNLLFHQAVNSKTARAGDRIRFTVEHNVRDPRGRLVLPAGTPVTGVVDRVRGRSAFGLNARIRIDIRPVKGIELEPRDKGTVVGGSRTATAAAASGGAALVFGPLGLIGGAFVQGHDVHIRPGDRLRTVVSSS